MGHFVSEFIALWSTAGSESYGDLETVSGYLKTIAKSLTYCMCKCTVYLQGYEMFGFYNQ